MPRLIDADALAKNGWVLERHGVSNTLIERMSIADVPTIEAEPVKHGRWKRTAMSDTLWCMACGKIPDHQFETDYCPNCGAIMDGGETNA